MKVNEVQGSNRPRILFVLKNRDNPYSCDPTNYTGHLSSGLFNSARFVVEMLAANGYEVKLVHCIDNNYIHREIVAFKADVVVIEAYWVVPEKFAELYRVCPNVKFIIRNHSDVPFVANEGIAMDWTLKYVKHNNVFMSCNSKDTTEEFRFLVSEENPSWLREVVNFKVPYLPNYYPTVGAERPKKYEPSSVLNVGCFGAIRPLKNQLEQAVAAMKYASDNGQKLRFHINGTRIEMNGSAALKNIIQLFEHFPHYDLVLHPWMKHDKFVELIRSMDILLQVSFSETFNIVAADAVVVGVPVVGSPEIPWIANQYKANPNDWDDIVSKMGWALKFPARLPWLNKNLIGLEKYNRESVKAWLNYLSYFTV
jgi:hypothetical protein